MATSLKYYLSSQLNEILPSWYGNCFDSSPVHTFQPDHGEMGIDLVRNENSSTQLSVRYSKQMEQTLQWKHTSIFPYRTATRASRLSALVGEKLATQSLKQRHKFKRKNNNSKQRIQLEDNHFRYQGNCLSSCLAPDNSGRILVSSCGSRLNKIGIESVGDQLNVGNSSANTLVMQSSKKNSRILQVNTHTINNKVLCGIRRLHSTHVLSASKEDERWQLTELEATKVNGYSITDLCLSPYIADEILYATNDSRLIVRDYTSRDDVIAINVARCEEEDSDAWLGCSFGAHPRCIMSMTRRAVHMYDTRAFGTRSCYLLQLPCVMIPPDEQVCCSIRDPTNSFLQYVAMTNTLLLLDERFTNQPVMKWSHLLTERPSLCDITLLPSQLDKVVLVGNITTQSTALIHISQETKNIRNLYSKTATKHCPQASDILDQFLPYSQETVVSRLSAPLLGLCAIPSTKKKEEKLQVIQMTIAGDIFVQSAHITSLKEPKDEELDLDSSFDTRKEWTDWTANLSHHTTYTKCAVPKHATSACRLFQDLAVEREHQDGCSFCCNTPNHSHDQPSSNTNHCLSCGNHLDQIQGITSAFKTGSSMAVKMMEGDIDLSIFGVEPVDTGVSADKRTLMILEAWNDDELDKVDSDTKMSLLDAPGSQSPTLDINNTTLSSDQLRSLTSLPEPLECDEDWIPSSQQDSQVVVSRKMINLPVKREIILGF